MTVATLNAVAEKETWLEKKREIGADAFVQRVTDEDAAIERRDHD